MNKQTPRSDQTPHEYYANYETCRNRWFDLYEPDQLQNEDIHLSITSKPKRNSK